MKQNKWFEIGINGRIETIERSQNGLNVTITIDGSNAYFNSLDFKGNHIWLPEGKQHVIRIHSSQGIKGLTHDTSNMDRSEDDEGRFPHSKVKVLVEDARINLNGYNFLYLCEEPL